MKLSILIPTYNYSCYTLVNQLWQQAEEIEGLDYEIIVADDGSKDERSISDNLKIRNLAHCRYILRNTNVGRARILNFLVEEAAGERILIMDSDALVPNSNFLSTYIDSFTEENDVVVGGLFHTEEYRTPENSLRWKYEKAADAHRSAAERNKNPYSKFSTFNFSMRRDTFLEIRFDADCKEYGYEDALFGVDLKRRGVPVLHIDNPLIHVGLEPNAVYMKKVETSLRMLKVLEGKMDNASPLIQAYKKLQKYCLTSVYYCFYRIFRSLMVRNLLSSNPNLTVLSLYKLGYYININK